MNLFKQAVAPIVAVGNVIDSLYTSDEERLTRKEALLKLKQAPEQAQTQINMLEAKSRNIFIAGWRPFIGWLCGINLLYLVCAREWLFYLTGRPFTPAIGADMTIELITALLGLGALRTVEKMSGRTK